MLLTDHSAENEEVVAIVEEVKQNGLSDEDVDPISKEKSEEGTEVVVTETPPDITYETVNVGAQVSSWINGSKIDYFDGR